MEMLHAHRIAVLAASGTDQRQLDAVLKGLRAEGGAVQLIGERSGTLIAWDDAGWGSLFKVTRTVGQSVEGDFEGLCIPGGLLGIDALRANKHVTRFVRGFFSAHKPVGAMGHATQLLVDANVLHGRKVTSVATIRTDLQNAGARWADAPVVVDEGLVTGRGSDDLPAFLNKMVEEVWEGRHHGQTT